MTNYSGRLFAGRLFAGRLFRTPVAAQPAPARGDGIVFTQSRKPRKRRDLRTPAEVIVLMHE